MADHDTWVQVLSIWAILSLKEISDEIKSFCVPLVSTTNNESFPSKTW